MDHIKEYSNLTIPDYRKYHENLMIWVAVVDRSDESAETGVVRSSYNSLSQTIKVEVVSPINLTHDWFSKFIPSFKRTVRHELEHYSQHRRGGLQTDSLVPLMTLDGSFKGKPERGPWATVGGAAKYYLNPVEIEAHVVGIQREARARRVKFHIVFKEIIEKICSNLRENGFDERKVGFMSRRLYQVWGFYALARYPSLRRRIVRKKIRVSVQKEFDFPRDE